MVMKFGRYFSLVFGVILCFSAFNLKGAQENYQFRQPGGLAFDSLDHLFVADSGNNVVVEFNESLRRVFIAVTII